MAINLKDPVYLQWQNLMKDTGDVGKLSEIFAPVVSQSKAVLDQDFADKVKKLRSSQAARGVLRSGVSDYPVTELLRGGQLALGGTLSDLAKTIGSTEAQRSLMKTDYKYQDHKDTQDYYRSLDLARQIAKSKKKSKLSQIFEGVNAFAPVATAAFGPGGGASSFLSGLFGGNSGDSDFQGIF